MYATNIFVLLIFVSQSTADLSAFSDPIVQDARLDFSGLTRKYGYPVEVHTVLTEDGYILTLHRIPYGRSCGPGQGKKVPVLILHGLFASSILWIIPGPEKSIAYILADNCYDVWLGNTRGTYESNQHVRLSRFNRAYWDFSWHEMGAYDLPAFIDYIIDKTGQPSLHYIGHSQGTTVFLVYNSLYPQYSNKIRSAQLLAPVAYLSHINSPAVKITSAIPGITAVPNFFPGFANAFGPNGVEPVNHLTSAFGRSFCRNNNSVGRVLCTNLIFLIAGSNPEQFNTTLLPAIVSHAPAGASAKQLVHFAQNIQSGGFRQYDYSMPVNLLKYGTLEPPSYNLNNVLAPVALHYSLNDLFVDVRDMEHLASQLPNLIGKFQVPDPNFSHVDFMWAIDAKPLVYDKVIEIMNAY